MPTYVVVTGLLYLPGQGASSSGGSSGVPTALLCVLWDGQAPG